MKTIQLSWVQTLFFAASLLLILSIILPAQAVIAQQVTSPSGIKAWFVADHTNPILTVKFTFRGGAALDPAGKEGLSNLVSGLLDEGAGDLKSISFQQKGIQGFLVLIDNGSLIVIANIYMVTAVSFSLNLSVQS